MLTVHHGEPLQRTHIKDPDREPLPAKALWIDLVNPTSAERAFVERTTGITVPGIGELSEIESSSRLATQNGTLCVSTPALFGVAAGDPQMTPLGMMLNCDRLVTVRFAALPVFDTFEERLSRPGSVHLSSSGLFVSLLEAMIDRAADMLEHIGGELDGTSHRIFRARNRGSGRGARREDAALVGLLRQVGQAGDLTSKIRDALLGVGRIVPYVGASAEAWLPPELKPHFQSLEHDIRSLTDYDSHLNNKIQFLLDATLGLINIEQNNIIKVLTVVSVVGVPPTFLASLYGMNFKHMPELDWDWGYPYVLILMLLSAVLPYVWFRWRGWL